MKRTLIVFVLALGVFSSAVSTSACDKANPGGPSTGNLLPPTIPPASEVYLSPENTWVTSLGQPLVYPKGCMTVHPLYISPGRGSSGITNGNEYEIKLEVSLCAEAPEYEGPLYNADDMGVNFDAQVTNQNRDFSPRPSLFMNGKRLAPGQSVVIGQKFTASGPVQGQYYMVAFYKGTDSGRFIWEPPVKVEPASVLRIAFPLDWK